MATSVSDGALASGRGGLGILGGTFNPPHVGHLAAATHARAQLGLEHVLLMPAHSAPHKRGGGDPGPHHRLAMCRLMTDDAAGLAVCELEVERGGASYTVDTLRAMRTVHPNTPLTFIVGADIALTLPTWRAPAELLGLVRLAVAGREGARAAQVRRELAPLRPAAEVEFLDMPDVNVSSSMVRARVARAQPTDGLLTPAVAAYIDEHGLYREPVESVR
ncbi:MAG TPA: nicotinate-nucleotide adenylyltransferase [Solirubrobacteraceae bacterium]|nr:nicotinate-nucleotide adenylyltransferase [Solirubrobacteraceae bacterium]